MDGQLHTDQITSWTHDHLQSPDSSKRAKLDNSYSVPPGAGKVGPRPRKLDIHDGPHTTFYTSTPKPTLNRHTAMSMLLKTSEGRERSLRFLQHTLRLYVFLKLRGRATTSERPGKTTQLLLVVFILSSLRKLRNLSELVVPFTGGDYHDKLARFAGSQDSGDGSQPSRTVDGSVSSTRWLWAERHPWAAIPFNDAANSQSSMPPLSDDASMALRYRLEGLETALSLLDTLADGVALFARLGLTVSLPLKLFERIRVRQPNRLLRPLQKLFRRSETLADLFWLLSTLTALGLTEWERREVWIFGKKVRRVMRDEESERDRREAEFEARDSPPEEALAEYLNDDDERSRRIKSQRRTLRELRGRLSWLWWERLRLGADAVFATYDVFELSAGSEAVRAAAGAVSAAVGLSQVWSESLRLSSSNTRS